MTQVNLLPSDVRQRLKTRQLTLLVGLVAAIVVAALLGLFVLENGKLSSANNDLVAAKAKNNSLQATVTSLQRFKVLDDQRIAQKKTVATAKSGSVPFSGVMHDLSMVIPSTVYLNSVTATLSLGDGASTQASASGVIGSIQFQGSASDHLAVALWLTRLAQVTGWNNAWITASTKQTSPGTGSTSAFVDFTGSVDLGSRSESGGK
jgi:Tfp pilus assembly protein PilN